MYSLFLNLGSELLSNLKGKEEVLFPYILQLVSAQRLNDNLPLPDFKYLQKPLQIMKDDHMHVGNLMKKIGKSTGNY